jgi:hypothetical protein
MKQFNQIKEINKCKRLFRIYILTPLFVNAILILIQLTIK